MLHTPDKVYGKSTFFTSEVWFVETDNGGPISDNECQSLDRWTVNRETFSNTTPMAATQSRQSIDVKYERHTIREKQIARGRGGGTGAMNPQHGPENEQYHPKTRHVGWCGSKNDGTTNGGGGRGKGGWKAVLPQPVQKHGMHATSKTTLKDETGRTV